MGTFNLYADFRELDDGSVLTKLVTIRANAQVLSGGIIYDDGPVPVVDGILDVDLPSTDCVPHNFGFTITRTEGRTRKWLIPAQAPDAEVELATFTCITSLPFPATLEARVAILEALLAQGQTDPRFPEGTTLPLQDDWQPEWILFVLRDSASGEVIDLYDKEGLPA